MFLIDFSYTMSILAISKGFGKIEKSKMVDPLGGRRLRSQKKPDLHIGVNDLIRKTEIDFFYYYYS